MAKQEATVVATGKIVEGILKIQRAGFLRVTAHDEGAIVSLVPVPLVPGDDVGDITVFEVGPEATFVDVVRQLQASSSTILQSLFGAGAG
ncbi:MAG: hypothetical protein WBA46_14420 [Thermomicrobiales bacterium]